MFTCNAVVTCGIRWPNILFKNSFKEKNNVTTWYGGDFFFDPSRHLMDLELRCIYTSDI